MGMAPDHLRHDAFDHVTQGKGAALLRHLAMEDHLQKQVTELAFELRIRTILDGIDYLIGLFDAVAGNRAMVLLNIPRASALRIAKVRHQGFQGSERSRIGGGLFRHVGSFVSASHAAPTQFFAVRASDAAASVGASEARITQSFRLKAGPAGPKVLNLSQLRYGAQGALVAPLGEGAQIA
jgi:hypothetical protein